MTNALIEFPIRGKYSERLPYIMYISAIKGCIYVEGIKSMKVMILNHYLNERFLIIPPRVSLILLITTKALGSIFSSSAVNFRISRRVMTV